MQVALALLLPVARERYLLEAVDDRLRGVGQGLVARASEQGVTPEQLAASFALEPGLDPGGVMIQVRGADGSVLASSIGLESEVLPFASSRPLAPNTIYTIASRQPPLRLRVSTIAAFSDDKPYYVQIASSLRGADQVSQLLQQMTWLALAVALCGTAIVGWWISGRVVSRVDRVAQAVRSVSPTRLDERIELPVSSDEIGRMAADVNLMLERMAVAFRSQERFMSEVSHELKTPVSALLTEAQVLKQMRDSPRLSPAASVNGALKDDGDPRRAVEPYERFVLSVEEEMRWLGKLVESFLMLARFGHGKQFVTDAAVPMNDVVLDAVEHSTLYARQHGVKLALTLYDAGDNRPEALVRGDSELLRVVADNLIRNAVQFSKRGDTVSVKIDVEADKTGDKQLVFTVKDQGPGVPSEYLARIFDRFAQAPGKSSTRRGSGLGLTIAKSITDLHGGTIDARNDPQGGCIFRVQLPMAPSDQLDSGVRAAGASAS
jgi:signal transduction histidine kinase